ncbi:MAG: FecR domain-containing protein [Bryobacterales bacterium]|nr:FecR domain-containing protein [Bryobacterales bacterium]
MSGLAVLAIVLLGALAGPGPLDAQSMGGASAAQVAVAEGNVSVIRSDQVWALFAGDQVNVGETIVTGPDGFAQLTVQDGSSFLVYPDSRVVFRRNPGNLRDLIDLFLGRVKVYIQHLGNEPNPHRIFTPTAVISVRGTTFDVSIDEDEIVTVGVDEGVVTVQHRLIPRTKETPVEAGQSLIVYPNVPLAKAGVDGVEAARFAGNLARIAASIWQRVGSGNGGGGSTGGGTTPTTPLPGDEEAPAPPPAPPPPQ